MRRGHDGAIYYVKGSVEFKVEDDCEVEVVEDGKLTQIEVLGTNINISHERLGY